MLAIENRRPILFDLLLDCLRGPRRFLRPFFPSVSDNGLVPEDVFGSLPFSTVPSLERTPNADTGLQTLYINCPEVLKCNCGKASCIRFMRRREKLEGRWSGAKAE